MDTAATPPFHIASEEFRMTYDPSNPNVIDALIALGNDPEVVRLQARVHELTLRLEDLTAFVHAHVQTEPIVDQPPPVEAALAMYYGVCEHGRILREPCRGCARRTT